MQEKQAIDQIGEAFQRDLWQEFGYDPVARVWLIPFLTNTCIVKITEQLLVIDCIVSGDSFLYK